MLQPVTKSLLLLAALVLWASSAAAVPPDERIVLGPGMDRFLKVEFMVTGVISDDSLVEAELLPSEEIFVTAAEDRSGTATVLAVGVDRIHAWEICVSHRPAKECPPGSDPLRLKKSCPDLAEGKEDGQRVIRATVRDDACYDALVKGLAHADVPPGQLRLLLEEKPANTFFSRVLQAIRADPGTKGLEAGYYGATLKLSGTVPREAVHRALLHAYRHTVGRVSYDDRTELPPGSRAEDKP